MNANKESTYLGPSIIQLCVCDRVDLTWRGHADGRVDDAMNSRKTHEERNGERTKGESEGYNFKDQGEMTHDGEIQCVSSESMHVYRSSHLGSTRHVCRYLSCCWSQFGSCEESRFDNVESFIVWCLTLGPWRI
jgi:hypothetical protein